MSKTQIRGPQKQGSNVLATEVDRTVVQSYSRNTTAESKRDGQNAAAAILPLRRHLWALAERLIPERLAAALRARTAANDPTGRDGVRELRMAIADWLDPPPACRWCGLPVRPNDSPRTCHAGRRPARHASPAVAQVEWDDAMWAHVLVPWPIRPWTPRPGRLCRASKVRRPASAVARCGTLALYAAGQVDLATMAAALATPRGAASGYDVAADRDCRALLAACAPRPPRDPSDDNQDAWEDEGARLRHLAVLLADRAVAARHPHNPARVGVPPVVVRALEALQRARSRNLSTNGRTGIAVQLRYHSPRDGVTRGDLTQGAMIGLDRGALDYDAAQARYTTYAAAWSRQGCGEVFDARDLVGAPPWIYDLRRALAERLHLAGTTALRDLLRAIDALADSGTADDVARAIHVGRGYRVAVHYPETPTVGPVGRHAHKRQSGLVLALVPLLAGANGAADGEHETIKGAAGNGGGEHGSVGVRRGHRKDNDSEPSGHILYDHAHDLLCVISQAEVHETVLGSRPARKVRRRLLGDAPDLRALAAELTTAAWPESARGKAPSSPRRRLMRAKRGTRPKVPWTSDAALRAYVTLHEAWAAGPTPPDPEAVRERVAAWVAAKLEVKASGPALLTALRHSAPVLVGIGAGGDDDEDAQGTDGAGGVERAHAILPAPDDYEAHHEEEHEARRWQVLLSALSSLRASQSADGAPDLRGQEAAEIVRRHHGLDSIADGGGGPGGGESFVNIGTRGLACSGRVLAKETVRKIYGKAIEALRHLAAGQHPELRAEDFEDEPTPAVATPTPIRVDAEVARQSITVFNRRRESLAMHQ